MAESVKRRVAAARLAVAFVAAGAITGAAYAQAGPTPPEAHSSLLVSSIKSIKLDSSNIKAKSLLFSDFKSGQVPSFDQFIKLENSYKNFVKAASKKYLSKSEAEQTYIKGESSDYLKPDQADARYVKLSDNIVQGNGSVHTATGLLKAGVPAVQLIALPSLVTVEGLQGSQIKVTNTSGAPLSYTKCGANAPGGTLAPGASITCDGTGASAQTVQLIGGGASPQVMTLNFSSISTQAGDQDTVQILIGL